MLLQPVSNSKHISCSEHKQVLQARQGEMTVHMGSASGKLCCNTFMILPDIIASFSLG